MRRIDFKYIDWDATISAAFIFSFFTGMIMFIILITCYPSDTDKMDEVERIQGLKIKAYKDGLNAGLKRQKEVDIRSNYCKVRVNNEWLEITINNKESK